MSDDGSITYASECAETKSEEEDYGGEDEEIVAHQEEPKVCHKVITRESFLAAQSEDLRKVVDFLASRFLGNSIEACTDIAHTSPMECGELVWEACRDKDK